MGLKPESQLRLKGPEKQTEQWLKEMNNSTSTSAFYSHTYAPAHEQMFTEMTLMEVENRNLSFFCLKATIQESFSFSEVNLRSHNNKITNLEC